MDTETARAHKFIKWWCDELRMRYGIGYSPSWRTDVINVSDMIKDLGAETLHRMAMQYMENPKRYSNRSDITIGVLFRYRNNILQKIELGDNPRSLDKRAKPGKRVVTWGAHHFIIEDTPKWAKHEHQILWRITYHNRMLGLNLTKYDRAQTEKEIAFCEYLLQKVEAPEAPPTIDPVDDLISSVARSTISRTQLRLEPAPETS